MKQRFANCGEAKKCSLGKICILLNQCAFEHELVKNNDKQIKERLKSCSGYQKTVKILVNHFQKMEPPKISGDQILLSIQNDISLRYGLEPLPYLIPGMNRVKKRFIVKRNKKPQADHPRKTISKKLWKSPTAKEFMQKKSWNEDPIDKLMPLLPIKKKTIPIPDKEHELFLMNQTPEQFKLAQKHGWKVAQWLTEPEPNFHYE